LRSIEDGRGPVHVSQDNVGTIEVAPVHLGHAQAERVPDSVLLAEHN